MLKANMLLKVCSINKVNSAVAAPLTRMEAYILYTTRNNHYLCKETILHKALKWKNTNISN